MTESGSVERELTEHEKQLNRAFRLDGLLREVATTAFTGSVLAAIPDDRLAPGVNRALDARARELGELAAARAEEARTVFGDFTRHEVNISMEMEHDRTMTAEEAARFESWMRTPDGNGVEGYEFPPRTYPFDKVTDGRPLADEMRRVVAEHGDAVPAAQLPAVIEQTVRSQTRMSQPLGDARDAHLYDAMAEHLVRAPGSEVDPRIQRVYERRGSVIQEYMSDYRMVPPAAGQAGATLTRDLESRRSAVRTPEWQWQRYARAAEQNTRSEPASTPTRGQAVNARGPVTATGFSPAKTVVAKPAKDLGGVTNQGSPSSPAPTREARAGREASGP
ncbi:hypothetical protein OG948_34920 (plasmid) [Embleya sp. NBC_00888]|uniref:hypothetical protein n=1 Tax=Embleya sp. NBC_00888 TaxID=2975960 RepID=UPI002F907331|nr:hypothetical protein OG948_34920 [Embleya sp. NBC_00888]